MSNHSGRISSTRILQRLETKIEKQSPSKLLQRLQKIPKIFCQCVCLRKKKQKSSATLSLKKLLGKNSRTKKMQFKHRIARKMIQQFDLNQFLQQQKQGKLKTVSNISVELPKRKSTTIQSIRRVNKSHTMSHMQNFSRKGRSKSLKINLTMNKTDYRMFFERNRKNLSIKQRNISFGERGGRIATTEKSTKYLLAYQPDYKKKSSLVVKTLPSFPNLMPALFMEDKVYLKRYREHIEYYTNRINEKYSTIEEDLKNLNELRPTKDSQILRYENTRQITIVKTLKLLSETLYLQDLIKISLKEQEKENTIEFSAHIVKLQPKLEGIVRDLYALSSFLKYESAFLSFIQQKNEKKQSRHIFFGRIIEELDQSLKQYKSENSPSEVIRIYITRNRQRLTEAKLYRTQHKSIKSLTALYAKLKVFKEKNAELPQQSDVIIKIMIFIKQLNTFGLNLHRYNHFRGLVEERIKEQKIILKKVVKLTFSNIGSLINSYEHKTSKLLENILHKQDQAHTKVLSSLLDSNQVNQIIIASVISMIDKNFYPFKKLEYTATLRTAKQFIEFIKFILVFYEMMKIQEAFLDNYEHPYSQYLQQCNKLMSNFQILDKYYSKAQDEISQKSNMHMFFKYPLLQNKLKKIRNVIIEKKRQLFEFLIKSTEDQQKEIRQFFDKFDISSKTRDFQDFLGKERGVLIEYKRITSKLIIFSKEEHKLLETTIETLIYLIVEILQLLDWLIISFKKHVEDNFIVLHKRYQNQFHLRDKGFLKFIFHMLKEQAKFLKQFAVKIQRSLSGGDGRKRLIMGEFLQKEKLEKNFYSVKQLFLQSKHLFLKELLEQIRVFKRCPLIQQPYLSFELESETRDLLKFQQIVSLIRKNLDQILGSFYQIQEINSACFENVKVFKKDRFSLDLHFLIEEINENELENYKKMFDIIGKIMVLCVNDSTNGFYESVKELFALGLETVRKMKGKTSFLEMIENLHQNIIIESINRRIMPVEIQEIENQYEDFIFIFKQRKHIAKPKKTIFSDFITRLDGELTYHELSVKEYEHLEDIQKKMEALHSQIQSYYHTLLIVSQVFEEQKINKQLFQAFYTLQSQYIWKNRGLYSFIKSKHYTHFEGLIMKQLRMLKHKSVKKCDPQLYSYIQQAKQNLIVVKNNLKSFQKNYKYARTIEGLTLEYNQEKMFLLLFLMYIISIRENVLVIYPKFLKGENGSFPPFIMPYDPAETLGDIHDRWSEIFFDPTLMANFRGTFLNPKIKSLISFQDIKSNEYLPFESVGPLEFQLMKLELQTQKFHMKARIKKPPYQVMAQFTTSIYVKRESIEREPLQFFEDSFEFDIESIVYPIGFYLIVQMDDCQVQVERFNLCDSFMELPEIHMLPIFQPDEMVQVQMTWQTLGSQEQYIDLDTHVDIKKKDGYKIIHVFNNQNMAESEKVLVNEEGNDAVSYKKENNNLSNIVLYKDFDPANKFMVYLYAFSGDFFQIKAQAQIFHHTRGFIGCLESSKSGQFQLLKDDDQIERNHLNETSFKLWKICEINNNFVRPINEICKEKESGMSDGMGIYEK